MFEGSVGLNGIKVERSQSKLILNMDIDTRLLKQGGSSETMLVPVLNGKAGETYRFPEVVISGRNRYYYRLRNDATPHSYLLYRSGKEDVYKRQV